MNNSILFSVGYPIGNVSSEKGSFFIEKYDGMYKLNNDINYYLWTKCVNGISYELLSEIFKKTFEDKVSLDEYLTQLIDSKFIIQFDINDNIKNYENIKNYKILRYGIGIGARDNESKRYVYYENDEVEIETLEYNVWLMCNGRNTIYDIVESFKEIMNVEENDLINIITAIVALCGKGLTIILGE